MPSTSRKVFQNEEVNIKSVSQSRKMECYRQERALYSQELCYFCRRECIPFRFFAIKQQRRIRKILRDYIGFTSVADSAVAYQEEKNKV